MPEPDLNLLLALDVLLAEGSVIGAARRLGLSASAMSRTLTRLRETTGDPLLVRAGRTMVLTPHAATLREHARETLHDAQTLLRPSTAVPDFATLQRTFHLRTNDGFVEVLGARLIAAVTAIAPGVHLRFVPKTEKNAAYLREGMIDLEIGVLGDMGPEVHIQALFQDRFMGVVRPGHPLSTEPELTAERYAAFGHVVVARHARNQGPVDDALELLGLRRTIVATVPSFSSAMAVARASDLIALVPASLLANPLTSHDSTYPAIHAFELPVATEPITVSQMWHPRLAADPVHRWLRQLVLTVCRERFPS